MKVPRKSLILLLVSYCQYDYLPVETQRSFLVRKLQKPFFKVEDLSRQYRPIIYEPSCWPIADSNCPPKACPFDHPRPDNPVDDSMSKKTREKVIVEEKKAGYCEPCAIRFDDLKLVSFFLCWQC